MEESGIKGVQLFPDITQLLLVLFADDLALINYTIRGLQMQLNLVSEFCDAYGLSINVKKTKVAVFRNGEILKRTEQWS